LKKILMKRHDTPVAAHSLVSRVKHGTIKTWPLLQGFLRE
jgi:hypothetical protein